MRIFEDQETIRETCSDLLFDESKSNGGTPSKVYYLETEEELRSIMIESSHKKKHLRFIGNHTGTTGGSIPMENEWAISFSHMNRIRSVSLLPDTTIILHCEPGITLSSIAHFLENPQNWPYKVPGQGLLTPNSHFYTPDPTEMNAQLGGSVATNASGARSFRFGATRNAIQSLSIVTADGDTFTLHRGTLFDPKNCFTITTDQGTQIIIPPFTFQSPTIKNASGYFSRTPMDLIDLFIGSEGTLGAISSIGIKLQKSMHFIAGCSFFTSIDDTFKFADFLRTEKQVASIELFDVSALQFIDDYRKQFSDSLPAFPDGSTQAILWEFIENEPSSFESRFDIWENVLNSNGSSFSNTWSGIESHEIERLKRFRHALPETVNATIASYKRDCPSIRKIGTDTALPSDKFADIYKQYITLIKSKNLAHAAFGHLGNYHMHINLLPSNLNELETALNIYDTIMEITIKNGGTISAEHGIGKLKKKYLEKMYGQEAITQMRMIKDAFDPEWRLNKESILEPIK